MPEGFSPASSFVGGGTPAVTPPVASTGFSPASSFVGGGTPAPAAPAAGNPESFTPAASMIPKASPDAPSAPGYFQSMASDGTFLGISDQKDISGTPLFAYKPPGEATTTDPTRVATTFDPRVAQVLNPSQIQNGRMPYSVSAPIKTALGGNYSTELDHQIALELAGSNNKANLAIEQGRTNGGQSAQFDTEENALAKLVQTGKMSLWDAQYKLASDKHNAGNVTADGVPTPIPFVDKATAAKGMNFPTTAAGDQVIANAGQDGLNASTIKYPFIDKMAAAGPSNNPIVGATKWAAELPEEVFNIGKQFLNAVTGKGGSDVQAKSTYQTNTPQDYMYQMNTSLRSQGVPAGKADWISALYGFSAGVLDITPAGDLVNSGVKALAEHAVTNEELVAAHTLLGSPSTVAEADSNFKAAAKIAAPDVVQGAGGSAEDIARANETMKALNNAHQIIQTEGIPRSGLMQKAASFAQKLTSPISDLGKTSVSAVAKPPVRAALPAEGGSGVVAPETRVVSVDEPKVGSSITHDGVPQNVTAVKTVAGEKSFTLMDPASGKETSVTAKELQSPATSRAVQGAAKAPANITPQTTPLPSIGTRSVSEVQADLNMALEHKAWLEDHLSDHPGRGVGKFINHRTGEFVKGGDVKAMQQMGQEGSGGGNLDTVLAHGENFKAGEAQLQSVKNEIARYQKEMKTATPDVVKPTETISPSHVDDMPDFPVARDNSVVLSASFPGAGTISKFITADVIPKGVDTIQFAKGVVKDSASLFSPTLIKQKGEAITGAALMRAEQIKSAAWKVADARRAWWANVPQEIRADFIDRMESGFTDFPKERETMTQLAKQYRERLNAAFAHETSMGMKENYIEDYFPHMWADAEKAKIIFTQLRASMGKGFFTKMRTIDLIKEGRALGLTLKTDNPEELVLLREMDGVRIGAKAEIERELLANGFALPANAKGVGGGWKTFTATDGRILAVPPDVYKTLDNGLFKPSLWSEPGYIGKIFRSTMAIKGIFIPLKLAISMFHPIHIAFIRMADGLTTAQSALFRGTASPAQAMVDSARAASLVFQAKDVKDFYSVVKAWDKPVSQMTENEKTIIGYIIDGGGTPKQSEENLVRSRDSFRAAMKDENYIGAAIRGFPKMVEMSQKYLFETYIPSLKIASYTKTVEHLMRAHPEFATDTVARKVAFREAWKSIDNRFGQMNYKTLFWKPWVKALGQSSMLSMGWQLGFVREFGGGALDLGKLIGKGVTGKAAAEDVTDKLLFSLNYTLIAATVGGLMTYAMTGERPKEIKDFFYPRTGDTNPDGTPARVNTSFYTREFFTLADNWKAKGLIGGTSAVVQSKMNPIMSASADLYNNSDFMGYQIRDTNAPAMTQAEQALKFWFSQTAIPISAGGAAKANTFREQMLNIAGFNAAPASVNRTAMQTEIFNTLDTVSGGVKPLASKAGTDAKNNIRKLYWSGDTAGANAALNDAVAKGYIAERGRAAFIKDLSLPSDVRAFQSLAKYPSEQEHLLSTMSASDLARYGQYASSKIKSHLSQLSPTAYQFVQDLKAGKVQLDIFYKGQVVNK